MDDNVVIREFYNVSRKDMFIIVPIGDIHLGNVGCQEERLRAVVEYVKKHRHAYWIGMGDYCEFINTKDPRIDYNSLARWITIRDLGDIARVQKNAFLDIITPIAHKCLALIKGNHEETIERHTERAIFNEIVVGIKERGGLPPEHKLGIGKEGYILLKLHRQPDRNATTTITIYAHHGYTNSRLAGARSLNMQRVLWTHNCDIAIMGHSHNTEVMAEAIEEIDREGNIHIRKRYGVYSGTFLRRPKYAVDKGYYPMPMGGCIITIKPGRRNGIAITVY